MAAVEAPVIEMAALQLKLADLLRAHADNQPNPHTQAHTQAHKHTHSFQ